LWKEFAALLFERQRDSEIALEEGALFGERPRFEHRPHQVRPRLADETIGREHRGQDVAASATADQDLAAAVGGSFEKRRVGAAFGREDRRHQPGCAGANDGY
jgi:hypothetical protein